jgi:hypothetical protein
MIGGCLDGIIGHKGHLFGLIGLDEIEKLVGGIALDVELRLRKLIIDERAQAREDRKTGYGAGRAADARSARGHHFEARSAQAPVTLGQGRSRRFLSMATALRLTESWAGMGVSRTRIRRAECLGKQTVEIKGLNRRSRHDGSHHHSKNRQGAHADLPCANLHEAHYPHSLKK